MSRCFPFPPPGYEKKARTDDIDLLKKGSSTHTVFKPGPNRLVRLVVPLTGRRNCPVNPFNPVSILNRTQPAQPAVQPRNRRPGTGFDEPVQVTRERKKSERGDSVPVKRKKSERGVDSVPVVMDSVDSVPTVDSREGWSDLCFLGTVGSQIVHLLNAVDFDDTIDMIVYRLLALACWCLISDVYESLLFIPGGEVVVAAAAVLLLPSFHELGTRIRSQEKGSESQLAERLPGTEPKNAEWMDRLVVKDNGFLDKGKENNKGKRVDERKIDGQGIKCETRPISSAVLPNLAGLVQNRVDGIRGDTRPSGSAVVPNLAGLVQNRVEGMSRPLEKSTERRVEEKEKCKEREGDKKRVDEQKDKGLEKKGHRKDKDREKETKKEKVKEKSEHKNKDQDKSKDRNKNDLLDTLNVRNSHTSKDGDRNIATEGNLKKRKDFETNGFLHENDTRQSKMPRPSPRPSTENGRKLEPCQTLILSASGRPGPPNNLKVDNKERKVNGVIEPQSKSSSSKKSSAITQADQIAQASMKPPHPDSKYLSQVFSVPKMEKWSDFGDQEWLFSSKDRSSEKLNMGSINVTEMPMVWDEAMQIESVDVCALPYVIPY
ncbi:hypothetical protein Acr_08g0013460 [Actinidia rufa]|uniref:Uncharacterized protein n=1 Tax=Actinidia rufa TaxID=165716 RepID=A0A7J0F2P3_9ERIC|nr:hypothetical protein Acr_08g0013460 [Actinidia rufa]